MKKIVHTEDVSALRRAAYPPLEELADALYWQSQGDNTKMAAYLAKVKMVKERFPKPGDKKP